jgi:hypothetical protein
MRRHRPFALLTMLFAIGALPASGRILCSGKNSTEPIDLTQNLSAETVRGPVTVELKNVNRLRYAIAISNTITVTPGPDLTSFGFIPSLPSAPTAPTTNTKAAPSTNNEARAFRADQDDASRVDREVNDLTTELNRIGVTIQAHLDKAKEAQGKLSREIGLTRSLIENSDSILSTQGEQELTRQVTVRKTALDGEIPTIAWPSDKELEDTAALLAGKAKQLEELPFRERSFSEWAQLGNNRDEFRDLVQYSKQLGSVLATIAADSDKRKEFNSQRQKLIGWHSLLSQLTGNESFHSRITASCGYPFVSSKTTSFKVTKTDRLATDASKATQETTLVTVECPTAFTVSGGVGITGINETDIKLVSAPNNSTENPTATVTKIAFEDRGSEQVNPMFLINTRLTDGIDCNWHASAGTVFDVDNPSSKVGIGYVLGLSLSLRENFFITGGIQLGRVARLTAGAKEGQVVPEGLAKPPTERHWTASWLFAASYKIR